MRRLRFGTSLLFAAAAAALGCGEGKRIPAGASSANQGQYGLFYYVNVSRPVGGTILSTDGKINCGTAGGGADACAPAMYLWSDTAALTAVPDPGNLFQAWAGDCILTNPCVLDTRVNGADKWVAAVFNPPGQLGHGDFSSPTDHGPRFLDFLGGDPTAPRCNTCHRSDYGGVEGVIPSCNGCHARFGWTGWQANCSFCHGARNATTQAGYDVAAHPSWAAPPDAVRQRLGGVPAPDRTGAHQAHLRGATGIGESFAPPFECATCHAVPADLGHVNGSGARGSVALQGAGQGSLPPSLGTYDQGTGSCATYCHGASPSPAWSGSGVVCGSCHALPPAPATGHPEVQLPPGDPLTACAGCHPDTVNADGTLNVGGGKHIDGAIQATGGHGDFTAPAVHGPRFFEFASGAPGALACTGCHGATYDGGTGPSCNFCHETTNGWTSWRTNCSFCHGARDGTTKAGYDVALHPTWAAPPDAVSQRLTGVAAPDRNGAHQAHLTGATAGGLSFASAFKCETCHAVPADPSHIGGAAARATVALAGAGQASLPPSLGTYDQGTGSCATYCHGAGGSPAWSSAGLTCNGCHGLPPAPATGHPDVLLPPVDPLTACAGCHPDTVNGDGTLNVGGGKHVDGVVQATGGHGDYTAPAVHAPRFFEFASGAPGALACTGCHGADYGGAVGPSCNACHAGAGWTGWQTNCSFCHGRKDAATQAGYDIAAQPTWAAPPDALSQRLTGVAAPDRTGAHQAHLTGATAAGLGLALPFKCETCHPVLFSLVHISGASARAEVALQSAGQGSLPPSLGSYDQGTGSCATYCHGASPSPAWSATLACGSCHGVPPAPATGHPDVGTDTRVCASCHPDTMNPDGTLNVPGGKHVDGLVQAAGHGDFTSPATHGPQFFGFVSGTPGSLTCTSCHGATFGGGSGPSCNSCHAGAGWTGWQTNCSFCHGARTAAAMAGYDVNAQPAWAAPPDAVSQRLTGVDAPDRTGAHQPHLTGLATNGMTFAPAFRCATCHAVPGDFAHVGGTGARAVVSLQGAGQASLPPSLGTYSAATGSCTTYCHGETLSGRNPATPPAWNTTPPTFWPLPGSPTVACVRCHGAAPNTGLHDVHYSEQGLACGECHISTTSSNPYFPPTLNPDVSLHVNGAIDVEFDQGGSWDALGGSCNASCHGEWRGWR
jgi:hypothetical protein